MTEVEFSSFSNIDLMNQLVSAIEVNPSLLDKVREILNPIPQEPLNHLLMLASRSFKRSNTGNRYDEKLKKISIFMYIKGGLSLYESISNIGTFPSSSEVRRCMYESYPYIELGKIYAKELKNYLIKRNLPLEVGISEDATRVKSYVTYDKQSKSLIGLKPIVNPETGMPNLDCFFVKKPSEIINLMKKFPCALFLEAVMALPFKIG